MAMGSDDRPLSSAQLLTGVPTIDRQHRVLFDTLAELQASRGAGAGAQQLEEICRDLLAYALHHFETEEEMIERYGYDRDEGAQAQSHRAEHREFFARLMELRARLCGDTAAGHDELLALLQRWLTDHIGSADQRLGRFILSHQDA